MKKNLLNILAGGLVITACLVSCQGEQVQVAKAILTDLNSLSFNAQDTPVAFTVYSDGQWTVTAPEWVTVEPSTGQGVVDVTVTPMDNYTDGVMDTPRRGEIVFNGINRTSSLIINVTQAGDKLRGLTAKSVTEIIDAAIGDYVSFAECQVMAADPSGFVVSDGTSHMYVVGTGVKAGDKVTFFGERSVTHNMPSISSVEQLVVKSNSAPTYPQPTDISATIASYAPEKIEYVRIEGKVNASGANSVVTPENAVIGARVASADLSSLGNHKAVVTGYSVGKPSGSLVYIVPVNVEDKGLDMVIYFSDDFSWIDEWSSASSAGDAVTEDNPSTTAPNVFTAATCDGFFEEFLKRGYSYFEGPQDGGWVDVTSKDSAPFKVLYLQKNYLKFGKTSYSSGIITPAMKDAPGTVDCLLEFDWCWQVTGAYKPDLMTLNVEVIGGGTVKESGSTISSNIDSSQSKEDGDSHIKWQHVSLEINGATPDTRFKIRPTNADPTISSTRKQNRWYLDNILVHPAE